MLQCCALTSHCLLLFVPVSMDLAIVLFDKTCLLKGLKLNDTDLMNKLFQSYSMTVAIWNHAVLPVTRHKRIHPAVTRPRQTGTRSTYPGGIEG